MNGKGFRGKLTLRTMAMPADTNTNGDVFGDWLVSQMDLATTITAKKHAKSRVTTIAIESVSFKRSVSVGDIVGICCDLYKVGTTSMKIHVKVWSNKAEVSQGEKVTEGVFIFVAINDEGKPRAIEI